MDEEREGVTSMATPRRTQEGGGDRARAVRYAASRARAVDRAEAALLGALALAKREGASFRELAAATGRPHSTIARLLERAGLDDLEPHDAGE